MYTPGHSRIVGVGSYTPERCITSKEIMETLDSENRFGVSTDWLERAMGIRERRVSPEGWLPSDLAVAAAKSALDDAQLLPHEIDAIIYAGVVRDYVEPSTAHIVQERLGARNALAFDLTNACLGFMNAIHVMDSLIATGQARRGLIVTGEQGFRNTDRAYKILLESHDKEVFLNLIAGLTLGDAGGALVMGPKVHPETGIKGIMVRSEGEHYRLCVCGDRGTETALQTDMTRIVSETARLVKSIYNEFTEKLGWTSEDISLYLPHQVGLKGLKIHMAITRIPESKIPNSVETMGNIISATIPYTLDMARQRGMLSPGQKVFLSGTGSGICAGQAGLIWDAA
jgi:3-oxoacyl-[acyl-carrier-protein] synthase-3